jgi:hypothetical protein
VKKRKRKKKMPLNVRKYLATLKRARAFGHVDRKEHEAIKRYHKIG